MRANDLNYDPRDEKTALGFNHVTPGSGDAVAFRLGCVTRSGGTAVVLAASLAEVCVDNLLESRMNIPKLLRVSSVTFRVLTHIESHIILRSSYIPQHSLSAEHLKHCSGRVVLHGGLHAKCTNINRGGNDFLQLNVSCCN